MSTGRFHLQNETACMREFRNKTRGVENKFNFKFRFDLDAFNERIRSSCHFIHNQVFYVFLSSILPLWKPILILMSFILFSSFANHTWDWDTPLDLSSIQK